MSASLVKTKVDVLALPDPDTPDPDWKRTEEFRRGRRLISAPQAAQIADERLGEFDYGVRWGGVDLPSHVAPTHFCAVGSIGSGKTTLLRLLMQSVLPLIGAEHKTRPREVVHEDTVNPTPEKIKRFEEKSETAQKLYKGQVEAYEEQRAQRLAAHQESAEKYQRNVDALTERVKPAKVWALRCLIGAVVGFGLLTAGNFLYEKNSNSALGFVGFLLSRPGTALAGYGLFLAAAIYGCIKYAEAQLTPPVLETTEYPQAPRLTPPRPTKIMRTELVATSPPGDGHRAFIYDAKGDIISLLHGMGLNCPIHVLNPLDARCAAWDMAADVKTPAAAFQLAENLIPKSEKASQPFFSNSARLLIMQVVLVLIEVKPDEWTFRDVVLALRTKAGLMEFLSLTPTSKAECEGILGGAPGTGDNVFSEIKSQMIQYEVIAALWSEAKTKVSLHEWKKSESILVLGNSPEYRDALDPINRVIFKLASDFTLAQSESKTRRTWFFLDEIREAGNLDSLGTLMNLGRSKGACVVLGFQDVEGMQDAFGEKRANELLGQANNKAILRVNSPQTAQWASDRKIRTYRRRQQRQRGRKSDPGNHGHYRGNDRRHDYDRRFVWNLLGNLERYQRGNFRRHLHWNE